jgi:very-short-patch-repair endonuclease
MKMDLVNDNIFVLGWKLMRFLFKLVIRTIKFVVRLIKNIIENVKHR